MAGVKQILIVENPDRFSYEVSFIPSKLSDAMYNSLNGDGRALAADIAFQVRDRLIPLHKRVHSLRAMSSFVKSTLDNLRAPGKHWGLDERTILVVEPSYKDISIEGIILKDGESRTKTQARRHPSVLDAKDPVGSGGDSRFTAFNLEKVAKEGKVRFTIPEFMAIRKEMRKIMRSIQLHPSDIREQFQLTASQCSEILNRPFSESGYATRAVFMLIYDYVKSVEAEVIETAESF